MYNTCILRNTYLVQAVVAKIILPYEYRHKFPVLFKIHSLCVQNMKHEYERGRRCLNHLINKFWGGCYLIISHGLDESLDLLWDLSITEQIQAAGVTEMIV